MSPGVLRLLSWNIKDHSGDAAAVRRVLRAARPDVVCLQEAWRFPFSGSRIGGLAVDSGLFHVCGGRRTAGTAVLSSVRAVVHDPVEQKLPVRGWRTRPRGTASATVGLLGHGVVRVSSVHLGLTPEERARHVGLTLDTAPSGAWVVAGDLNEEPDGPSWQAFSSVLRDADPGGGPTFPARRPKRRIDAVLVSPDVEVLSAGYPRDVDEADVLAATDHRPVLVEIALPPA